MNETATFISIDVETAGPNPGSYSLLSIGACLVSKPDKTFYCELQPVTDACIEEALQVSKLDMDELKRNGLLPAEAMQQFAGWIASIAPADRKPVFVAFNAPFDWMFVTDYFHRYLGYNPFGHKALDIKAYFMGLTGVPWEEAGFSQVTEYFNIQHPLTHNALQDAIDQAEVFRKMLEIAKRRE